MRYPTVSSSDDLASYQLAVRRRLDHHFPDVDPHRWPVNAAVHYSLRGGHNWRPLIVLAAYRVASGEPVEGVLDGACALEAIHCCTIIVDDLPCVDNAELRRGVRPCHMVFGEDITIYASHLLYAKAVELAYTNAALCRVSTDTILAHFDQLRRDLIEAQVQERLFVKGTLAVTDSNLSAFYALKASTFSTAAWLGALLGGADAKQSEAMRVCGEKVGIAYQLGDDLQDLTGSSQSLGKRTHMDRGKVNALTLEGPAGIRAEIQRLLSEAHDELTTFGERASFFHRVVAEVVPATI